ncbi:MAG: hypothetical protein IPN36_06925 [Bacteroidetes bacterium]|nr:hypothetical protein [Bacteroidota bacterium]
MALATGLVFSLLSPDDNYLELSRNPDIFTTILRELTIYYVDPTDPKFAGGEGINSMLESLDPHAVHFPEEEADDYRFITAGQYGASVL